MKLSRFILVSILRNALAIFVLCLSASGLRADDATPTKADAVGILKNLLTALEAKDAPKAASFFRMPDGVAAEKIQKELLRLLELKELSGPGIAILETKGKWGKLTETMDAARAERFAGKFGVPVEKCYGLTLGNAEAGFYWDGRQLLLIRCDDIGKLNEN